MFTSEMQSQSSGRENIAEHESATLLPELLSTPRPTELRGMIMDFFVQMNCHIYIYVAAEFTEALRLT